MPDHPYGPLSLLPPLVAIVLAVATRRVIASLVAGIFVGALVTTGGNLLQAIHDTWETHLWRTLIEPDRLRVFSFTLLMGSLIGVITRCGGMQGLIEVVSPLASNRRRGQLTTWVLGMVIFFDDYANTILLGGTLRPICDRLKISREKLAYLVDSTAAPVAGLALVSTWVAVEIAYVRNGLINVDVELGKQAFNLFLASIPYRFYMIMALLFVPLTAILGRDFGGMLTAERRRVASDTIDPRHPDVGALETTARSSWYYAVVPIAVTVGVAVYFMYTTGRAEVGPDKPLWDVIGNAASSMSLQYGSILGLGTAALMARWGKLLDGRGIINAIAAGAWVVAPAILILWCASTVSSMTGNASVDGERSVTPYQYKDHRLYTGDYLKTVLTGGETVDGEPSANTNARFSVKLLPTIVFVLSGIVAFATGTSWGTMGILLPMVVTLAHALLTAEGAENILNHPIMICSVGGVLAGAVFGDHCSPISDTTVLSSQCCGCNHIAHVWTQMPYAILVATVSILLGTLPLGYGVPVTYLLPIQFVALVAALFFLGQKVEEA
jgi:Na+/H+ antiporter NhaC